MTWCSGCQGTFGDKDGGCGVCPDCLGKLAGGTGPCIGCGERNHTAHNVSICAECIGHTRRAGGHMAVTSVHGTRWLHGLSYESAERSPGDTPRKLQLSLTHFEASMVLCVLAVAKAGASQFDEADAPVRRRALEEAYRKLSASLGVDDV